MENLLISIVGSIIAAIIMAIIGMWWWKTKNKSSIELATRVLKYLDGEAEEDTNRMVQLTQQLGDSLVKFYKSKTPYNTEYNNIINSIINKLLSNINPLATELTAANPELNELKKSVNSYREGLQWRSSIVKHLCHPPNPSAMDPGHVRDQLVSENLLPQKLLKAAQGEAAIFLRGYGVNWIIRRKYLRQIVKKQRALYNEAVEKEYRSFLQQTALHNAKNN